MLKQMIIILLLLFIVNETREVNAELVITEIMYNPPGIDSKHEWIEIYNNGEVSEDINGWKLREGGGDRILNSLNVSAVLPGEYALIVEDENTLSPNQIMGAQVLISKFSSGLSNKGEELALIKNSTIYSYINYTPVPKDEGCLCSIDYNWSACLPTPGKENLLISTSSSQVSIKLEPHLNQNMYTQNTYKDLFKISRLGAKSCADKANLSVSYNISGPQFFSEDKFTKEVGCSTSASTGEFIPLVTGEYTICGSLNYSSDAQNQDSPDLTSETCFTVDVKESSSIPCNVSLQLKLKEDSESIYKIFKQGQSIKFTPSLNTEEFPYVIEYWIEDLFGNIIKSAYNTTNTNQKSWNADISEEDRILKIKMKVHPSCKDDNTEDNYAEQMILITNEDYSEESTAANLGKDSYIEIGKITPENPVFGDILRVELEIYHGDTNKYSISAVAESEGKKAGEATKINVKSKYTKYELTLPVQTEVRCDTAKEKVTINIGGLDTQDSASISLGQSKPSKCKTESSKKVGSGSKEDKSDSASGSATEKSSQTKFGYKIINLPKNINNQPFAVQVELQSDDSSHQVLLWGYLYRGSQCYSCGEKERDANKIEVSLQPQETKVVPITISPDTDLEAGNYKLKVKINKDELKTDYELTEDLAIKAANTKESELSTFTTMNTNAAANELNSESKTFPKDYKGITIYTSTDEKAKTLLPYILALAAALICLVFVFKDKV